mmetsp:Transcript_59190/g.139565  ORF Transcript_59190/g.139565 Transcript_59190/m.139565 type:complete len:297 (+) Transcript_59190:342-1232(+)
MLKACDADWEVLMRNMLGYEHGGRKPELGNASTLWVSSNQDNGVRTEEPMHVVEHLQNFFFAQLVLVPQASEEVVDLVFPRHSFRQGWVGLSANAFQNSFVCLSCRLLERVVLELVAELFHGARRAMKKGLLVCQCGNKTHQRSWHRRKLEAKTTLVQFGDQGVAFHNLHQPELRRHLMAVAEYGIDVLKSVHGIILQLATRHSWSGVLWVRAVVGCVVVMRWAVEVWCFVWRVVPPWRLLLRRTARVRSTPQLWQLWRRLVASAVAGTPVRAAPTGERRGCGAGRCRHRRRGPDG